MSDVEDPSYVRRLHGRDPCEAGLNRALVELGEELLLNERTEAEYAFAVRDATRERGCARWGSRVGR